MYTIEGPCSKGGINPPRDPNSPRPPAPQGSGGKPTGLTPEMLGEAMKLLDVAWRIASSGVITPDPAAVKCLWCEGTIHPNDHKAGCRYEKLKADYSRLLGSPNTGEG